MDKKQEERLSRYLSFVLRHHPEAAGITLHRKGAWAEVDALLHGVQRAGKPLDLPLLEKIVCEDRKQRYSFSPDHRYIRANQGHSVDVDLGFEPLEPPAVLYHGTATRFLDSIRAEGITRQSRQYVHLSRDVKTAFAVGGRHGIPVVLELDAAAMHRDSIPFYLSENGVWLCDAVPWHYVAAVRRVPDKEDV
ncbi:MAG: RNA 2'-phosphotransferase [Butyricicoccus sp.]